MKRKDANTRGVGRRGRAPSYATRTFRAARQCIAMESSSRVTEAALWASLGARPRRPPGGAACLVVVSSLPLALRCSRSVSLGWHVLRFTEEEVIADLHGVVQRVVGVASALPRVGR